jgi:hypothetical protein
MLVRAVPQGHLCITQPAHAWISGQLARAWGNQQFGLFAPWQEVCLGAEQHDIGWLQWEPAPTLNLETGLPYHFTELPTETHIKLWSGAKYLAAPLNRYATLLVSLHGTGLYERYTRWQQSETVRPIVEDFLAQETAFQRQLVAQLQQDAYYQQYVSAETIARNRRLVAVWDQFSLLLCGGMESDRQIEQVPITTGEATLTLSPDPTDQTYIKVEPWCFRADKVRLVVEGRILEKTFTDEAAMRVALVSAPWQTLTITLISPLISGF